ncbi:hypothetical protein [Sorangium sp. So ce1024]|uniref:hypothetical protein n=1 Tax=Sorangium sp. So ce1024 TaxID=3133327 RepID=UPI003EFE228E
MEASSRPIPPPHDEDDEDVHWALSTAAALWARGEREEALRWLRRAAEQASDANADLRALELFKAAAEVAQQVALDPGAAPTQAADGPPAAGSVPPKASVSAPPQAPGAPAAGASAPPPRPGAPGPSAQPSRPPAPAGADAGRAERGGAGASSPSAVKRAPLIGGAAGSAPPGPAASRDAGAPRAASGSARPAPLAPERTPMPVKPVTGRPMPPTQPPTGRTPGPPPVARPAAAGAGGAASTAALGRAAPAAGRAIAGFSSAQTRVSSTTAVTEEVPVVRLPVASVRLGRGDGAALKGAGEEQHATEVEPPPDQRETVPTNMAVGPERPLGSPLVGGASSQEATERRPLLWAPGDEEGTTRRPLTPQEQRVLMEHRIEDLDEETPMLGLEQMADSGEAPADAPPEGQAEADERGGWTEAEPDDDDGGTAADPQGEAPLTAGDLAGATPAQGADAKAASWVRAADDRGTSAADASWSDAPYEGEWKAPPPRLPAPQIEPLPALRVAVIGISSTGELRLVPMDGRNAPPRGAALGILVPLSPGDGETIARLLQLRG